MVDVSKIVDVSDVVCRNHDLVIYCGHRRDAGIDRRHSIYGADAACDRVHGCDAARSRVYAGDVSRDRIDVGGVTRDCADRRNCRPCLRGASRCVEGENCSFALSHCRKFDAKRGVRDWIGKSPVNVLVELLDLNSGAVQRAGYHLGIESALVGQVGRLQVGDS